MVGALIRDASAQQRARPPSPRPTSPIPTGFAGVYGPFRLLPSGTNQRNLAVLEVRERHRGGDRSCPEDLCRRW
jgi:hypothetical protein